MHCVILFNLPSAPYSYDS